MVNFMHRLIIGPRKAVTTCGIRLVAYYPMSETGLPACEDTPIKCTTDGDAKIDCAQCLAAVGAST